MRTLRSTTGTAPITFMPAGEPDLVCIGLEDGSGQVYYRADLIAALRAAGVLSEAGVVQ
ncbi:hypothetical protein [Zhihengliuella halotolerans]|uniref:hypothetical protein n=1 Tax=Zhihengliuella halotolerans TaxID=370736 RepID=UPI0015E12CAC|nr:hypothetical protein [Zhihengliuella halotolerans]